MTTINGKPLEQIIEELQAPFDGTYDTKNDDENMSFIATNYYKERMRQVLGEFHYMTEYTPVSYQIMKTGQELFYAKCRITILDDAGNHIITKECCGGTEAGYTKKSDYSRISGLQNLPDFACKSAFRNACKELGIFGIAYETKETKEQNKSKASLDQKKNDYSSRSICLIKTKGAFIEDNKTYKCLITPFFNGQEAEDARLVIYKNKLDKDKNIAKFIEASKTGSRQSVVEVVVKSAYGSDGLKQFIFQKFKKG